MTSEPENTLICMMGLPRSGKSTWANESGYPMVNPDSIRLALHGQPYYPGAELFVWAIAKVMVQALFKAGHEIVVLDATNTTRGRRDTWRSRSWKTLFKFIPTDEATCVARAEGDRDDLIEVIHRMAKDFMPLEEDENDYDEEGL